MRSFNGKSLGLLMILSLMVLMFGSYTPAIAVPTVLAPVVHQTLSVQQNESVNQVEAANQFDVAGHVSETMSVLVVPFTEVFAAEMHCRGAPTVGNQATTLFNSSSFVPAKRLAPEKFERCCYLRAKIQATVEVFLAKVIQPGIGTDLGDWRNNPQNI